MSRDWLEAEYRTVHDYFMKYRHNFAAHSGDEQLELTKSYLNATTQGVKGAFKKLEARRRRQQLQVVRGERSLGSSSVT